MTKFIFFVMVLLFAVGTAIAQDKELMVKSSDKGLYIEHKVAPKESFFAMGRMYNVSPQYIASFNNLDMNKGLQIDQKVRIPLTDTNFNQQVNSGIPVYYKAGSKQGLKTASDENNNVSVENLRLWNNIPEDDVKKDTKLIIGFLLSKEMPVVTLDNKPADEQPVKTEEKPADKPEVKAEEKPEVKIEEKPVQRAIPDDQGYFKSHYEKQIRVSPVSTNETVTSGIFKTTSGWEDAKYYLLIDKLPPGTIVKIINPSNNKTVYAKVLGEMSGIRQNEGFNIRMSNAAASALEITEPDKFIVKVNY